MADWGPAEYSWWAITAFVASLIYATQVSPTQAVSNSSQWLSALGWRRQPIWLSSPNSDRVIRHMACLAFVVLVFVAPFLFFGADGLPIWKVVALSAAFLLIATAILQSLSSSGTHIAEHSALKPHPPPNFYIGTNVHNSSGPTVGVVLNLERTSQDAPPVRLSALLSNEERAQEFRIWHVRNWEGERPRGVAMGSLLAPPGGINRQHEFLISRAEEKDSFRFAEGQYTLAILYSVKGNDEYPFQQMRFALSEHDASHANSSDQCVYLDWDKGQYLPRLSEHSK